MAGIAPAGYLTAAVLASTAQSATDAQVALGGSPGTAIEGFALPDTLGRRYSLDQWADCRFVVVAFLGIECPLVRLYVPRLAALAATLEPRGVGFVAIDSNCQDSLDELADFTRSMRLPFPLLKDPGNQVADQFGALRTPEVFVLDAARVIRYRGRIDDQFSPGIQRAAASRHDLAEALEELLDGRPVSQNQTAAEGCLIGRVREARGDGRVTWTKQIERIFQKRCQTCHRPGQVAPFALQRYEEAVGWGEMIAEVIEQGRMPPWHASREHGEFANDPSLDDEERAAVLEWVRDGCPQGDPADAPPPARFASGWQIGAPDQVVSMAAEPYQVPAEGTLDYQYFTVDPGLTEGKWLQAVECRPGNPAVLHHMAVWVLLPGRPWLDAFRHFLAGSAAGAGHMRFPEGTAYYLPPGVQFVFVMHYTPNGTPQRDLSQMGMVFAEPRTIRRRCWTVAADRSDFVIPPYAESYALEAWYHFDRPLDLVALFPHMHLRGRQFRYVAHYPDESQEVLLAVDDYDFNWQENYVLAQPKRMPAGTRIQCLAVYDNSPGNPVNPDPSAAVAWGHQSWDEMMDGFMQVSEIEPDPLAATTRQRRHARWWPAAMIGGGVLLAATAWRVRMRRQSSRAARSRAGTGAARGGALEQSTSVGTPAALRLAPPNARRAALVAAGLWLSAAAPAAWLLWDTARTMAAGWLPDSPTVVRAAQGAALGWLAVLAAAGLACGFAPRSAAWARALPRRLVLLVIVVLAGGGAASWSLARFDAAQLHRRAAGAVYEFDPAPELFPGVVGSACSSYNRLGLRAPEPPAGPSRRYLCLGGSTAECAYLDDDETWPQIAAAELAAHGAAAWVGNGAIQSRTTADHLRFVEASRLLEGVDGLLVMPGLNDLLRLVYFNDSGKLRPPAWYEAAAVRFARRVWNEQLGFGLPLDPTGADLEKFRRNRPLEPRAEPPDVAGAAEVYADRLARLIRAARRRGVEPTLITQPVLWDRQLSWPAKQRLLVARVVPAGREWSWVTAANLRAAIDVFNAATRRVAQDTGVAVIDGARLSGDEHLFYDDVHLNEAGCRALGSLVAAELAERPSEARDERLDRPGGQGGA